MTTKNAEMQDIFNVLSEKNKDILILLANSIKVAQIENEQLYKNTKPLEELRQDKKDMPGQISMQNLM
ncbi:hypothetical protein AALB81_16525 [Lachnospiraceae bacterium 48-33]